MIKKLLKTGISFLKIAATNRPRVYWWSMKNTKGSDFENFGDIITPYLVKKITKKKPFYINFNRRYSRLFNHSLMVGSIISYSEKKSIVWGSGIISQDDIVKGGEFIAVRGPRTAKRLKELGFNPPSIFGDPALLLPMFYNPNLKKRYKTGVISHYVDYDDMSEEVELISDVLHINLLTNSVEDVIDLILQCDTIISTSLHGVIVAHAYSIPAIWWKYSQNLGGDDIKFTDYYESVGINNIENYFSYSLKDLIDNADFKVPNSKLLKKIQLDLISSFPYKKA